MNTCESIDGSKAQLPQTIDELLDAASRRLQNVTQASPELQPQTHTAESLASEQELNDCEQNGVAPEVQRVIAKQASWLDILLKLCKRIFLEQRPNRSWSLDELEFAKRSCRRVSRRLSQDQHVSLLGDYLPFWYQPPTLFKTLGSYGANVAYDLGRRHMSVQRLWPKQQCMHYQTQQLPPSVIKTPKKNRSRFKMISSMQKWPERFKSFVESFQN